MGVITYRVYMKNGRIQTSRRNGIVNPLHTHNGNVPSGGIGAFWPIIKALQKAHAKITSAIKWVHERVRSHEYEPPLFSISILRASLVSNGRPVIQINTPVKGLILKLCKSSS
ncbi:hypothetical protein DI09_75p150 [Mitosporidium daphniae]|uniref:Uncharacterized protein n=1 Tax=Mitosporidium daphniae TaxID=1485682 RepID=A0A098VN43_9MICR|nr:uncharacterized protein DI09_75p150 [Mitosporidium daphniae]KGG50355.1 hypothetical protein DI09_75p150 [Mitosporidium daphniae]|eukprot:XP_013236782.1 uncharacterized protein DI09_75p150 [Mitosporidium daphniae]